MLYFCKRCGFETIQRANMRSHLQRQKPCEPKLNDIEYENIKDEFAYLMEKQQPGKSRSGDKTNGCKSSTQEIGFKCPHCDMSFKHKQSRHNHLKLNRCPVIMTSEKMNDNLKKENMVLRDKVLRLEAASASASEATAAAAAAARGAPGQLIQNQVIEGQQSNTNNTNSHNQINITINNYGEENVDYITEGEMAEWAKCSNESVLEFIQRLHLDPDHPENHNVRAIDPRSPWLRVRREGDNVYARKQPFLSKMLKDKKFAIDKHLYKMVDEGEITEDEFYEYVIRGSSMPERSEREKSRELHTMLLNWGIALGGSAPPPRGRGAP